MVQASAPEMIFMVRNCFAGWRFHYHHTRGVWIDSMIRTPKQIDGDRSAAIRRTSKKEKRAAQTTIKLPIRKMTLAKAISVL